MASLARTTLLACAERCKPHARSAFVIGSVARGGFSPVVSDLDLVLIMKHKTAASKAAIASSVRECQDQGMFLADRLSVFYATRECLQQLPSNDEVVNAVRLPDKELTNRFPMYDRIDFIDNGVMLFGEESERRFAVRPSMDVVALESGSFALARLRPMFTAKKLADLVHLQAEGTRMVSKSVLFPARLLCTLETGELAHNDVTLDHFTSTRQGDAAQLVAVAHALRESDLVQMPPELLTSSLVRLWAQCVGAYSERLCKIYPDRMELLHSLQLWHRELKALLPR